MTRARIRWGMSDSQRLTACDTDLTDCGASGHNLYTNKYYRRTSVLKGDGATRAYAVTDAIRRGVPMIDDG